MTDEGSMRQHDYLSTACHHGLHERCRKACKFCGVDCNCNCHREERALAAAGRVDDPGDYDREATANAFEHGLDRDVEQLEKVASALEQGCAAAAGRVAGQDDAVLRQALQSIADDDSDGKWGRWAREALAAAGRVAVPAGVNEIIKKLEQSRGHWTEHQDFISNLTDMERDVIIEALKAAAGRVDEQFTAEPDECDTGVALTKAINAHLKEDETAQLRTALKPFADAAPKDGEYLRPVRLVYDPSGDKGSLSPEDFLNARVALAALKS